MPFPGEAVPSYLARLRAMRRHLELLIGAVERGVAARGPVAPSAPVRTPVAVAPALQTQERPVPAGAPMVARPARTAVRGVTPPATLPRPAASLTSTPLPPRPRLHVVPVERPVSPDEFVVHAPERRDTDIDRRAGNRDRRAGHPDRRRGHPDPRAAKVERRAGPRDRRSGRRERRSHTDRRSSQERSEETTVVTAARGVSPVMVFWSVNIVCWVAVVIIAFVWGVG